jgi:hypothetical protein
MTFTGEHRFQHWADAGVLHREEFLEPVDPPIGKWSGLREVYCTVKEEEWRVPVMRLIWRAAGKSDGWNEHFERLEGMLFGCEDWQNDWWIATKLERGGFGGATFCCTVVADELKRVEQAGFRALPPVSGAAMTLCDADDETGLQALLTRSPGTVAVLRFTVPGRRVMDRMDLRLGGPWEFPASHIPELNQHIKGAVVVVRRRDNPL